MFNKLLLTMVVLLNSNLENSARNKISIGIAAKENKYIAYIKEIVTQAYTELDKTLIWKSLPICGKENTAESECIVNIK